MVIFVGRHVKIGSSRRARLRRRLFIDSLLPLNGHSGHRLIVVSSRYQRRIRVTMLPLQRVLMQRVGRLLNRVQVDISSTITVAIRRYTNSTYPVVNVQAAPAWRRRYQTRIRAVQISISVMRTINALAVLFLHLLEHHLIVGAQAVGVVYEMYGREEIAAATAAQISRCRSSSCSGRARC